MRKKGFSLIAIVLMIVMLAGCSPLVENVPETTTIYTTFYPVYALTQMIAEGAENVEVHCLVQPQDECYRAYQLSDWDYYMLGYAADALIAAGNGLESFSDQLKVMGESALPVIEVMTGLEMAHYDAISDDEDSHFAGDNPHLYMSVDGATAILKRIYAAMMLLDSKNEALYENNLVKAQNKLEILKDNIKKQTTVCTNVSAAVMNEALFYVATDCGLDINSWYERENGEMLYGDALDDCLADFAEKQVELVLIEQQAPKMLVDALEAAGYAVVKLDVLSTLGEIDGAAGYIDALASNAAIIAEMCGKLN